MRVMCLVFQLRHEKMFWQGQRMYWEIIRLSYCCRAEESSGPRALPCCGPVEQLPDFLIHRRRKILVPLADSEEWNRSHRAHDVVHLMAQLFAGGFRSHGHGRNDLCRLPLAQG